MDTICKLCGRRLDDNADEHHLIPREYKGTEVVRLHRICHRKIHSVFTNKELAKTYNTIPKILEHPWIQVFVLWVKDKPIDFYVSSKTPKRKVINKY